MLLNFFFEANYFSKTHLIVFKMSLPKWTHAFEETKNAFFGIIWLVGETQCNVTTIKWLTPQNLPCQAFISHQSQDFRGGGCCHCCHTQLHRGFHFATSRSSCPGAGGKEIEALGKNSKLNWTEKRCQKRMGSQKPWENSIWDLDLNEFRRLFQDGSRLLLPMHQIYPPCYWTIGHRPLVCRTSRAFGHLKVAWVAHSLYIGHLLQWLNLKCPILPHKWNCSCDLKSYPPYEGE